MKIKNKILGCILLALMIAVSCDNDEFLDRPSQTNVSASSFWTNDTEAVQGVNGIYRQLRTRNNFTWLTLWEDVLTDDATWMMIGEVLYGGLAWGLETPAGDNSYTVRAWSGSYEVIASANTAIAKIPEIDMDANLSNRLVAEAKFMRAYFYHRLYIRFGDVPLLLKLPEEEPLKPFRTPKEKIIAQIRKDLTEAIPDLEWQYSGDDIGRVTKGAAYCMLARNYLMEGNFQQAADAADKAMKGPYQLLSNFADLWTPGIENTEESLWEIQYLDQNNAGGGEHWRRGPSSSIARQFGINRGAPGGGFSRPLQDVVNEFESAFDDDGDGIIDRAEPFANPQSSSIDEAQFENRDPRLWQSILYHGADYYGTPYQRTWIGLSSYNYRKYTASRFDPLVINGNQGPFNWIEMRYAEVLLQFAEATNEVGGPTPQVYTAINQVRNRVGMPDVPTGLSTDQMREYIHREWRVEFVGESKRFEFLLRTNQLAEALRDKHLNPKIDYVIKNWNEYNGFRRLWPINQQEMDANSNLVQNPGY